ncbi:MAG: Cof-type HAD-IIB family hydrolase [Clostridiales bacterium]|jgi:HAD superfamily hydrolase (TIGR01484 family)|nr:Cof-type HAD-IIB family hydrolase [Clostridiales bacterium]
MPRTLFVSDLDGTILDATATLPSQAADTLNTAIKNGANFTIATGRGESALEIIKPINFNLPIIMLNGALIYDCNTKEYLMTDSFPTQKINEILDKTAHCNIASTMFHGIDAQNKMVHTPQADWSDEKILDFGFVDTLDKVKPAYQILQQISDISVFLHPCPYNNTWFCDVTNSNVSKAKALSWLRDKFNFDKIIAFGDSLNDLSMAESADEFYAVANAHQQVKAAATDCIGYCVDSAVPNWIIEHC